MCFTATVAIPVYTLCVLHSYFYFSEPWLGQSSEGAFKNNGVVISSFSVNDCGTQGSVTNFREEEDGTTEY